MPAPYLTNLVTMYHILKALFVLYFYDNPSMDPVFLLLVASIRIYILKSLGIGLN